MPNSDPRLDWLLRNPDKELRGVRPVYTREGIKLLPWWESIANQVKAWDDIPPALRARIKEAEAREQDQASAAFGQMRAGLPEVKRTSARDRIALLTDKLLAEAVRTQKLYGYPILPRSIVEEICRLYGNDLRLTPAKVEQMTLEKLRHVLATYAQGKQEKSDNKYRRDLPTAVGRKR